MSPAGWPKSKKDESFDPHDRTRGRRLHKLLAEAGVGSRRACETLIESGEVEVNGRTVDTLPAWADPERDEITVNGERVVVPNLHVYVLLNKPRGVVCTNNDPEGRRRAIDLVQHPSQIRLYPVGRLDADSGGLLLLTNDGDLANRLTHPRYGVHKTYEVMVKGNMDEETLDKLRRGFFLPERDRPGRRATLAHVERIRGSRDRTALRVELREGRNRQVRRMLLAVGHPVRQLRRVSLGPLVLKGLRPGQWRDLLPAEITALKKAGHKRK